MPFFRKLPIEIEAVRIQHDMEIQTLEGRMVGRSGDWLITGIKGEQYICADDVFRLTYEPVDERARRALEEYSEEEE